MHNILVCVFPHACVEGHILLSISMYIELCVYAHIFKNHDARLTFLHRLIGSYLPYGCSGLFIPSKEPERHKRRVEKKEKSLKRKVI